MEYEVGESDGLVVIPLLFDPGATEFNTSIEITVSTTTEGTATGYIN